MDINASNQQPARQPLVCDHCTKQDCKNCVTDGGKNFCCQHCCDDAKRAAREEKPKAEPNVCKFC